MPKNKNGYFFAVAHKITSQQLMQQIAEHLYDLGLVTEPTTYLWPSDEAAGASLGLPPQIAHLMGTHRYFAISSYCIGCCELIC